MRKKFIVSVSNLKSGENRFFISFPSSLIETKDAEIPSSIEAQLILRRNGDRVDVKGEVDFLARFICSRCLVSFKREFKEKIEVEYRQEIFRPKGLKVDLTRIINQDYYSGDEIDLFPLIRDVVILALPMAPVCKPDCKGLCPICGKNLNEGECGCRREETPPWKEALKGLKVKLGKE